MSETPPFDEPVRLPLEDELDLHAFAPRDLPDVVEEFVEQAWRAGLGELRLVHGKGKGVARARVHAVLARHPRVARFAPAPEDRGGWGATIVWLRGPADEN